MAASVLLIAYWLLGMVTLISQAIMLREVFVIASGNEFSFGIALACWLCGVFIGSLAGGRIASTVRRPAVWFDMTLGLFPLLSFYALTLIRVLPAHLPRPTGAYLSLGHIMLTTTLSLLPLGMLIGLLFPLATRVLTKSGGSVKSAANAVYISESAGALSGGLLYSFLLIDHCQPCCIIGLLSLPILITLLMLALANKGKLFPVVPLALILPLLLLLQPKISTAVDGFLVGQRWRGVAGLRLISTGDSRYQNIALGENAGQYNLYSNGQLATSFPNDADNQVLAAQLLCQHAHPRDILILGEAAGGLARFVLNYPIRSLTVVEIDRLYLHSELAWLKPQELSAMKDPRLRLIIGDGLSYLNGLRRSATFSGFDIVFLHLPDPATALLNRFYTEDFFRAVQRILAPAGVLALQLSLPENYTAGVLGQYSAIIYQTLSAVFPRVALSPALNLYLFAAADPDSISQSAAILAQRYRSFNMAPANLAMVFPSLYPAERIASLRKRLAELPVPGLNSNERPVGYYAYSKVLGWYSDKSTAAALALLEGIPNKIIMALSVLAMIFLAIYGRQRARSKQVLPLFSRWTLAVAGFAGLSFEIVLLYAFQCLLGQIYHAIGLFTALFMFGIPLGAMLARQSRQRSTSEAAGYLQIKAALDLLLLAILIALFPHLFRLLAANKSASLLFIGAAMISCGFLVGALFPIMLSLHATQAHSTRLAGRLYAYDNIGGAMGALVTAAVLVPLWGVSGVCITIAFLLLNSAILLFFSRRLGK